MNRTIVIVDEDDIGLLCEAINDIDAGASILFFKDSCGAINFFSQEQTLPDLIIIDYFMPNLDGEQCLELIRNMPSYDPVKIPVLSSAFNNNAAQRIAGKQAVFLPKPGTFNELVKLIAQFYPR
jgi:CheY-like chemotaxis protein